MFKDIDLGENKNLFVVSAILIAGIGGLAIQIPYHLSNADVVTETIVNGVSAGTSTAYAGLVDKSITVTSIATALILGIITYAVMNKIEKGKLGQGDEEASVPSAAVENSVEPKLLHGEEDAAENIVNDTADTEDAAPVTTAAETKEE